jgi:hypothetical protein
MHPNVIIAELTPLAHDRCAKRFHWRLSVISNPPPTKEIKKGSPTENFATAMHGLTGLTLKSTMTAQYMDQLDSWK